MRIREAKVEDAEKIATVHVNSWKTTYKGIISDTYLSNLTVEKRLKNWLWTFENLNPHEKIFVAENTSGDIVGFSSGGKSRNDEYIHKGELYAIYLSRDHQRMGLGKILFESVIHSLKENGYTSMMLWVLKDNPSVEFYKKQGGQVIGQKRISIGGDELDELAIGWEQIASSLH
jgi:ribosomal protein S18 acetylase RimI-like enzyme